MSSLYEKEIMSRSPFKFLKGLVPRIKNFIKYRFIIWIARRNGATIGDCVSLPYKLARSANSNLKIGNHSSIQTNLIDLRAKVTIGDYVIIGSGVDILTCSHDIDSKNWDHKAYGIVIEDYCWLATKVFVLPSCRKISKGSICAAGSVVVKNVDEMSVVSGNPAKHLKYRQVLHSDLCVETLRGNDLIAYVRAYRGKHHS